MLINTSKYQQQPIFVPRSISTRSQDQYMTCQQRATIPRSRNIWLVVSNMCYFPFHIWDNPSHWRTHIFQRGRYTTNQYLYTKWIQKINNPQDIPSNSTDPHLMKSQDLLHLSTWTSRAQRVSCRTRGTWTTISWSNCSVYSGTMLGRWGVVISQVEGVPNVVIWRSYGESYGRSSFQRKHRSS